MNVELLRRVEAAMCAHPENVVVGQFEYKKEKSACSSAKNTSCREFCDNPYKIWSLWDMIANFGEIIGRSSKELTELIAIAQLCGTGAHTQSEDSVRLDAIKMLQNLLVICTDLSLPMTILKIEREICEMEAFPIIGVMISLKIQSIQDSYQDELTTLKFMNLPFSQARLFEDTECFGAEVKNAFPSSTFHIEEAQKCMAIGRYTASAYHLCLPLELVVRALSVEVNIKYSENWKSFLDAVDSHIKSNLINAQKPNNLQFISAISLHLRLLKDAYRNETMHGADKYTEEEARNIYQIMKQFMILSSKTLKETGSPQS